jgi:hypothetical protein
MFTKAQVDKVYDFLIKISSNTQEKYGVSLFTTSSSTSSSSSSVTNSVETNLLSFANNGKALDLIESNCFTDESDIESRQVKSTAVLNLITSLISPNLTRLDGFMSTNPSSYHTCSSDGNLKVYTPGERLSYILNEKTPDIMLSLLMPEKSELGKDIPIVKPVIDPEKFVLLSTDADFRKKYFKESDTLELLKKDFSFSKSTGDKLSNFDLKALEKTLGTMSLSDKDSTVAEIVICKDNHTNYLKDAHNQNEHAKGCTDAKREYNLGDLLHKYNGAMELGNFAEKFDKFKNTEVGRSFSSSTH